MSGIWIFLGKGWASLRVLKFWHHQQDPNITTKESSSSNYVTTLPRRGYRQAALQWNASLSHFKKNKVCSLTSFLHTSLPPQTKGQFIWFTDVFLQTGRQLKLISAGMKNCPHDTSVQQWAETNRKTMWSTQNQTTEDHSAVWLKRRANWRFQAFGVLHKSFLRAEIKSH